MIYSKVTILVIVIVATFYAVLAEDANITSPTCAAFHDNIPEQRPGSMKQQVQPNDLNVKNDLFSRVQVANTHKLHHNIDQLHESISNITLTILLTQVQCAPRLATIHKYDNDRDIRLANGPQVNQEKCIKQLKELVERAELQQKEKHASVDINFHRLLDTFGRVSSGLFLINTFWSGLHEECLKLKINSKEDGLLGTRYCIASSRHNSWPESRVLGDLIGYESGVCLPKTCDSINYKNKYHLIQELMRFNERDFDKNQTEVNYLYCLPDDDSPMRMWWKSPLICVLTLLALWIAILIYSSIMHKQVNQCKESKSSKYFKLLSLEHNYKMLVEDSSREKSSSLINLQTLDGIKVICMLIVIMGHSGIFMLKYSSNVRDSPISYMKNYSFCVSISFTITGILTSYKLFKANNAGSMLFDLKLWSESLLRRYVRIIPAYAFVFALGKYITVHLGFGPQWDYGTSSLSSRRMCQQESWLWPLLLASNYKSPQEHCLMPGWYLGNDFQFAIVAPLFLYILYKYKVRGKIILALTIVASMIATSYSLFAEDAHIVKQLYNFPPFAITLTTLIMYNTYNLPIYRISAYLIGLLVGYELHVYEKQMKEVKDDSSEMKKMEDNPGPNVEASWFNRRNSFTLSLIAAIACFSGPALITTNLDFDRFEDYILFIIIPLWPIVFILLPMAIGFYISKEATRTTRPHQLFSISKLLSASIWKLLAKLNLSVLVVHCEVLQIIVSRKPHPVHLTFEGHLAIILQGLVATYIAGFLVYIFIEAPMGLALNQLVTDFYDSISSKKGSETEKRKPLGVAQSNGSNKNNMGWLFELKRELDYFTSRIIKNFQRHFD